jgi:hypothetical protein
MKLIELAELLLAELADGANAKGHENYFSLDEVAAKFGETDGMKVMEVGKWLESQSLADVAFSTGSTGARITARGMMLVEEGGRTGAIQRHHAGPPSPDPFPLAPGPSLTREDVVRYLVALQADGHAVHRGGYENAFNLTLDDKHRVLFLQESPGFWQVQYENFGVRQLAGRAGTLPQLETVVAQAAQQCGKAWPARPTTRRLSADTPATNYRTIGQLVGSSHVEAVFDPFLDNLSLATLIDILGYGSGDVANGVRLLGSTKKTGGPIPKLTKAGVDAWLTQLGKIGETRVMPPSEHRRFMLLSGGLSLILGMSLNAIHKNEAVRVEPDAEDRAFFDSVWATATPLS